MLPLINRESLENAGREFQVFQKFLKSPCRRRLVVPKVFRRLYLGFVYESLPRNFPRTHG